ncbi:GTPase [Pectobacterium versatile]|uniref:GTPase n=2 Tax=Pectobacterium versatile TaxID=2488639 RepID=UPI00102ED52C|nr:GTPase [Pectobacterium versatile]TAI92961.1 dGTPase [Pectobacterium versatile]
MMNKTNALKLMLAEDGEFAECYRRWQQKNQPAVPYHQIAICGLMNAGKSSLLNMLTGHMDREYFATGASRTTAEVQTLNAGDIDWLDTPGIDARERDDLTAWHGILSADSIIFAHNLRSGTLEQIELDFLQQLQQQLPDLSQRMLVALTHADGAEQQREERLAAINALLCSHLDASLPLFITSCPRYARGVYSHKETLINLSGIPTLREAIDTRVQAAGPLLQASRERDRQQLHRQMMDAINTAITQREAAYIRLKAQQRKKSDNFSKAVNLLMLRLSQRINDYNTRM